MSTPFSPACCLVFASACCVCPSAAQGRSAAVSQEQITVPSTAEIERQLVTALNAERFARGLQNVREVPGLVTLARQHSADLAGRNVVSHDSETGTPYQQRLTDAGVASVVFGENVGRSGTFLTPLIHQAFMDSPVHRQNMLHPAFDSVGVGVAGIGSAFGRNREFPGGAYVICVLLVRDGS